LIVGVCKIVFRITDVSSLKGKRSVVKKLIERTRNRFRISIAETGLLDDWHGSEVGLALVGNDASFVNSRLDRILDFIEDMQLAEMTRTDIEIITL